MSDIRGDWYLLEVLRKTTLADVPDAHWEIICKQVVDAEGIVNLSGQARQIVFDGVEKAKSFGGDRSAAGRYAATMRWMKQNGGAGPEYITADKMPRGRYAPIGRAPSKQPSPSDYKLMGSETSQDAGATLSEIAQRRKEWQKILRDAPADSQEAYNAKGVLDRLDRAEAQAKARQGKSETSASAGGADGPDERTARAIASPDLGGLARAIRRDLKAQGKKVPFGAEPYLDALESLGSIKEKYYEDSGESVVAYLLSNLGSYRGANAKAIKAELKRRLKEGDPTPKSESSEEGLFPAFPPPRKTTGYEDLEVQVPKYRASESRRRAKEKQKNGGKSETNDDRKVRMVGGVPTPKRRIKDVSDNPETRKILRRQARLQLRRKILPNFETPKERRRRLEDEEWVRGVQENP